MSLIWQVCHRVRRTSLTETTDIDRRSTDRGIGVPCYRFTRRLAIVHPSRLPGLSFWGRNELDYFENRRPTSYRMSSFQTATVRGAGLFRRPQIPPKGALSRRQIRGDIDLGRQHAFIGSEGPRYAGLPSLRLPAAANKNMAGLTLNRSPKVFACSMLIFRLPFTMSEILDCGIVGKCF